MQNGVIPIHWALAFEYGTCGSDEHVKYGKYCPLCWRRVFELYFGEPPIDDGDSRDKRWDDLFRVGFPAYEEVFSETSPLKEAAE